MLRRSAGSLIVVGSLLVVVGCKDKAEPDYLRCVDLEKQGDMQSAYDACNAARGTDPDSKDGKLAAQKMAELQPVLDKLKAQAAEAERQRAEAAKKAAEEQAAKDAACHNWTTICTIGRFPDGSEQTTGIQHFSTKADCEGIGAKMGGIQCDPCKCRD
jgi:pyruvate/2-oxoglutarate dehydrogenase complex dihydrolipoamide acyltransferase (E2) component